LTHNLNASINASWRVGLNVGYFGRHFGKPNDIKGHVVEGHERLTTGDGLRNP